MKNYNYIFKYLITTFLGIVTLGSVALAADGTFESLTLSLTDQTGCTQTTYTFTQTIPNDNNLPIDSGNSVVITFPAGTDASTFTGGTFSGIAISGATATATQISFNAPVSVSKKSTFTIVLNGITNGGNISANCTLSTGNTSGGTNSGTYTLTTNACPCANISSFPWTEDFDGETTPAMPACWAIEDNSAPDDDWETSSTYASSSPNSMFISWDGSNALDDWAFSPGFSLTSGISYRVEFVYRASSSSYNESLELFYGTGQSSGSMTVELFDDASFNHETFQTVTVDFTPSSTDTYYFGWHAYSIANQWGIYVDDVVVSITPSCPSPTNLSASSITATQANLSWTDNAGATQWDIELGSAGFSPTGTPTQTSVTNPYTYTGLSATTDYEYYVRADCGGGDYSNWVGPYAFTTPCGVITPPWLEDFSTYLPNCWSETAGTLAAPSTLSGTTSSWVEDGFANVGTTEAARVNIYSTTSDDWLISPSIDLGTGTTDYQLEFDLALTDYGNAAAPDLNGTDDKFAVVISTDNGATWTSANTLQLWDNAGSSNVYNDISYTGEHIIIDLTGYTGTVKFGFYGESTVSNADNELFVDNVEVIEIPTCPQPVSLTATNILPDQADITWTEFGSATQWDIEYGASGFTQGAGTTITGVTTNPYTLTGLSELTDYEYYVRADCGGEQSLWTGPFGFSTTCSGLSGTVDVGTGQIYESLTGTDGLFERINACGLEGNLTVNITSDLTEDGTHGLNEWAGSYTLTIQPSAATLRDISGNVADEMIRINGADNLVIDGSYAGSGQYLHFENTNTSYAVIEFLNDAGNNTIQNALIEGGSYGIYFNYNDANDNLISNCSIYDFDDEALYYYYSDGTLVFSENEIYQTTSKSNSTYGVKIYYSDNCTIEKNHIYNLQATSNTVYGVYLYYSNAVVRNNMISLSPSNDYTIYGIYYSGSTSYSADIYFNSIFIGGSSSSSYSSYAVYKASAASAFNFKNNIVYNDRTGSTSNQYAAYFSSSTGISSENNQFYASNATYGYVGYWISTACQTLSEFQLASSQDSYSFEIEPTFASSTDLHISAGTGMVGSMISGISDDIDGEVRTSPAIGADEIAIPNCTGTPNAGTASISSSSGCKDVEFTISVSDLSVAPGISYQWQSSADGSTGWTDITDETSPMFTTSVITTTYYRLMSTCSHSTETNYSNVVSYTVTGNDCVCGDYLELYATNTADEDIVNVTVGSLNNSSTLGELAGGEGSIEYRYSNYTGIVAAPDLQQLETVSFSLTSLDQGSAYSHGFQIYIDYNHDGIFSSDERAYSSASSTSGSYTETGTFVVPITAEPGVTRMRVVCVETTFPTTSNYAESTYSWGETEDYCVNITPAPDCTGEPNAGTASISAESGCNNVSFTLTATGLTAATGISYQWQSSANGTTGWSEISGATGTSYTTSVESTTYFRLVTTCALSAQSNITNVVSYTVTGNDCICIDYTENYVNYYNTREDIGNVTVGSLNNSSTLGELASGEGSVAFEYSNYTGIVAAPDLQQLESVSFSLTSLDEGTAYSHGFQIYIDYNHDGAFSSDEQAYSSATSTAGPHTETGIFSIPITAEPGITRMRVICVETSFPTTTNYAESTSYIYGETEDYCVNITPAPDCSGTPNAGTANIDLSNGCLSTSHTVSATGFTAATGIVYQWQYSLDGLTGWFDIPDADGTSYTTMTDVTTYYRLVTSCENSGLSNNSNVVSYTVNDIDCCTSTLNLYDVGGDGWDGGYVTVSVGGVEIGDYTLASGAGPETISITSDADEAISIVYTDGTDYDDNYFDLIGPDGTYYAESWYPSESGYNDGPWNGRGCPIPHPGDMCDMSIAFCTGVDYSFPTGVDNPPAPDGPEYGCLSTQPNPIYYYLRVDQPGAMEIEISSDCGDVDFAAWGPFDNTTCDFNDLTAAGNPGTGGNYDQPYGNLIDCAYSTAAIEYLEIPDGQAGEYYMIMINNYANCDGIISFSQISGEGSSDCSVVAPPVSNNGPYCVGQDIELTVNYPVTGATYLWTGPNSFTSTEMNPVIVNANPDDSGIYSLIITLDGVDSDPETTEVFVDNPQPLTPVSTGDFVFRNIGNSWNVATNWLECTGVDEYAVSAIIPTAIDNVIICAGTTCASNEAIIASSDATCNNLTIETDCLLTMQGAHDFTVHSDWQNNGTYSPGTGTVVFNGNTTMSGTTISHDFYNITINSASTLTAPNDNLNLYGNWLNNGTFNHNTGTITLLGAISQEITSGGSPFYNLTVQNSSTGISLLDNATVQNSLSLLDGVVSTGANYLISENLLANAIVDFSNQSFIYGTLRKYINPSLTYPLPVGKGINPTDYLRADLISSISGGTNYVDVEVNDINEINNNVDANLTTTQFGETVFEVLGEQAVWSIIPDNQPTGSFGVRLYVSNMGLGVGDDNTFCVVKRPSLSMDYADWNTFDAITTIPGIDSPGRITDAGIGYAERTGYTSFSEFSIAKWNIILPVDLIRFDAECSGNSVTLTWLTASELNNDYFTLSRSYDGERFTQIANIQGQGNSNQTIEYSFVDEKPSADKMYYRLSQTDYDGTTSQSDIVFVNCKRNPGSFNIIPNPFKEELLILFDQPTVDRFYLRVTDMLGSLVFEAMVPEETLRFQISELSKVLPGTYYISLIYDDSVITKKIIKM